MDRLNTRRRYVRLAAASLVLTQITACLGPDPQFLLTTLTLSSLVSNIVTFLFNTTASTLGLA